MDLHVSVVQQVPILHPTGSPSNISTTALTRQLPVIAPSLKLLAKLHRDDSRDVTKPGESDRVLPHVVRGQFFPAIRTP